MRCRAGLQFAAVIVVLVITWGIAIKSFDVLETARNILGCRPNDVDQITSKIKTDTKTAEVKCSLSRACPPDHFAFHIRSGAANIVGPKICFEGKIIMSHVLNNVGPGLNIVVVNGQSGIVEKFHYLNMKDGNAEDIMAYLTGISPGRIVLVASFGDVTKKMTKEMREGFAGMGSTLIKSVKHRDNWVFAGRVGTGYKSLFEQQAVNDEKTNKYEGWANVVEVGGCFPRTPTAGQNP